ncbi:tRNA 4-thiouridine(8) synthase ThiI [Bacillus aquiflavi]|uniref:Probable tRNA sulfurtransferase n=1 Tax=Bacillus aquiflavi TaxID=2672567 RepID=A0A6B3VYC2_9BACI|nr:tRNA uracil 4-sulfurtransferase ThiI [Bacillus aquiflavi]MBA4537685.1 tRNA 4-thiouridine(8) synthase ThiI [Bacillus aquiflavi]NEY81942.1 tRNA 4-thiouridine(8) synthase ThiI [Bacillus aquiflavi]UAC47569.1 tRNA 4-thiouridine(8) synthase ThiI [Bacillus aquiflavi]
MNYDRILIRYGELSLKKRNRQKFINQLRHNVKNVLADFPTVKVEANRERMYVLLNNENGEAVVNKLKGVFGIQTFSPAIKVEKNLENMKKTALALVKRLYREGNTFKITTKRADKAFPYNSDELNNIFGGFLLKNIPNLKVDVKQPDINLRIEVRKEAVYLSCENIEGAGGLPVGSSGKGMLMLSGGIDSPVAGYLAMKRGLDIEAVHFFSPPYTSERAKQKVIDLTKKLAEVSGSITLHVVPFTEIQQLIRKQIPENYTMTTTRRIMLRITDELRKKNNALAIITGESLGQVASQTLESMYTINEVTNTPILRPLIAMDKTEIIDISKRIDTHDISIRPYEDCCTIFVPANPKTNPRRERANHFESFTNFDPFIQSAVLNTETILLKPETLNDLF